MVIIIFINEINQLEKPWYLKKKSNEYDNIEQKEV